MIFAAIEHGSLSVVIVFTIGNRSLRIFIAVVFAAVQDTSLGVVVFTIGNCSFRILVFTVEQGPLRIFVIMIFATIQHGAFAARMGEGTVAGDERPSTKCH
jgi:hypothetical protein